jgi:hypothetical protein
MSDPSVRKRRVIFVVSIVVAFAVGGAAGVLATAGAAERTTQRGLEDARGLFAYDQAQRVALAWNAGDMNEALAHARCAYEVEFAEGARWFEASADPWRRRAGPLYRLEPNAAPADRDPATEQGLAQAKIAVVLARLGRADEARERLERAARAGGRDVAFWEKAGLMMVQRSSPDGFLHPDGSLRR